MTVNVAYTLYVTVYVLLFLIYIRRESVFPLCATFSLVYACDMLFAHVAYTVMSHNASHRIFVHKLHSKNLGLCSMTVADLILENWKSATSETVPKQAKFAF